MRLYWEIARRSFRRYAGYRAATAAGVFTNTVFGFLRAYVFIAVFAAAGRRVGGLTVSDALAYTFLTQGMLMTVAIWGWWDIALAVRSGQVAVDLFRPLDFQAYWLAQDLGRAAYQALARGVPPIVAGAFAFRLALPRSASVWLAFLASVLLAVVVSFGVRFPANLSAFWLLDHRGVALVFASLTAFLGGAIVPVSFFPSPLRAAARALPFYSMIQAPVEVALGRPGAAGLMAAQAAWALALLASGRVALAAARRKLVVQGG